MACRGVSWRGVAQRSRPARCVSVCKEIMAVCQTDRFRFRSELTRLPVPHLCPVRRWPEAGAAAVAAAAAAVAVAVIAAAVAVAAAIAVAEAASEALGGSSCKSSSPPPHLPRLPLSPSPLEPSPGTGPGIVLAV